MFTSRGATPLVHARLAPSEMDLLSRLEFAPGQMERFLGPLSEIVAAVRRGPAHHVVGVRAGDALVGFYVIHPDRRDRTCWWIGWLALDRRVQGGGFGRPIMAAILRRLLQVPGCRRVRLLVAPDNEAALRLYARAGFLAAGIAAGTAELIMECVLTASRPAGEVPARFWANAILVQVVMARICRMGLPVAAKLHGEVAHPP